MTISFYASKDTKERVRTRIYGLDSPNWSNGNAESMLGLLELGDLWNAEPVEISIAFRAVIAARARFDIRAPRFVREEVVESRYVGMGLDEGGIWDRLNAFEDFLIRARDAGAKVIYWA